MIWYNVRTRLWHKSRSNLYYNYEKYPLSPLKLMFLVLIEQYLPNISDPVYSVHQSFMWFLLLNWRKSIFYPVTAPNDSKCWLIVTSSIQEPAASNCDVTMTGCSRVVAMDAFVAQWNRTFITAQWSTENTSCFPVFVYFFLILWPPVIQHGASLVYINCVLVHIFYDILHTRIHQKLTMAILFKRNRSIRLKYISLIIIFGWHIFAAQICFSK